MRAPRRSWAVGAGPAALVAAGVLITAPGSARADGGLEVVPVEGGTWAAQIAALQANPGAAVGSTFRVRVVEDDTRRVVPCGQYGLTLDARGSLALGLGACDPSTGATDVVLVDRGALFAPGDPVPVPQPVGVTAVAVRQGGAGGGAASAATSGVEMRCAASVRPYVTDLLHGGLVYLTPGNYRLEPLSPGVTAVPQRDAWSVVTSGRAATVETSFRVVDVRDGREVARSRVAMRCAVEDLRAGVVVRGGRAASGAFDLPVGAVGRGSTVGGAMQQLSCTEASAPTVTWRFVAPADGRFELWLQGGYATALEVRAASGAPDAPPVGCSHDAPRRNHAHVVARLRRGVAYDLVVSGRDGAAGRYEVAALPVPPDLEVVAGGRVVRVVPNSEP